MRDCEQDDHQPGDQNDQELKMTIDQGQVDLTNLVAPALLQGVALAARPLEDLLPLVRRHLHTSFCLDGWPLTDSDLGNDFIYIELDFWKF